MEQKYMSLALDLANASRCNTAKVGAVLEKEWKIIGYWFNTPKDWVGCDVAGCSHEWGCDRTTHAEIIAIRFADLIMERVDWATIYTTHYPCDNCADTLEAFWVKKAVYLIPYKANKRKNKSLPMEQYLPTY